MVEQLSPSAFAARGAIQATACTPDVRNGNSFSQRYRSDARSWTSTLHPKRRSAGLPITPHNRGQDDPADGTSALDEQRRSAERPPWAHARRRAGEAAGCRPGGTGAGDRVTLQGYGADAAQTALGSATITGVSTAITLPKHTAALFVGVTDVTASAFV